MQETSLDTNNLFSESLITEDETWTIQVMYPDGESPDSDVFPGEDTLISLENVENVEEILKSVQAVKIADRVEKRCKKYEKAKVSLRKTLGNACPKCDKIYNARRNLLRHINLECGKEPKYACMYCQYKNYRRNEINNHMKKKHGLT
ncbi:unnamed protein product [Phaedon cochleariae]|uniref:C2H2-type domain-containing protein n=1 Tax=Phaedon cochleariae TaxID=80249 RepID=A0A9N9X4U3_PHACE|nr:unnamed protein product [Phaedon cochleariae]